jgi:hypothetical protein
MLIVFMMAAYTLYMATIQAGIQSAVVYRIQSQHMIENAVNRFLYSNPTGELPDSFKYMIYEAMKHPNISVVGQWTDEETGAVLDVDIVYSEQDLVLKLSTGEEVYGNSVSLEVIGSCVNSVYQRKDTILSPVVLTTEEENVISESLEGFSGFVLLDKVLANSYVDEMDSYDNILVTRPGDRRYKISKTKGLYSEDAYSPYPTNVLYIAAIKNPDGTQPKLVLDSRSSYSGIKGIIFVEGDLEIISNLKFSGIIIVKNGDIVIKNNAVVSISGMIVSNNTLTIDPSLVKRADDVVGQLIFHLPGFFRHEIDSIKVY